MKPSDVAIPQRMKWLEKDARGYPIPVIVFRDDEGKPHFTINDSRTVALCLSEKLCAICGRPWKDGKLGQGMWLLGGPMSAFHKHGAYIDTPVHHDCGTYALQVCPYLAAPIYSRRIDGRTLDPAKAPDTIVLMDQTMIPERPEMFVFVKTREIEVMDNVHVRPVRPYLNVEIWDKGTKLGREDTRQAIMFFKRAMGEDHYENAKDTGPVPNLPISIDGWTEGQPF